MDKYVLDFFGLFFSVPFLAIVMIVVRYQLKRATWKRKKRLGKTKLGFCPSSFALGTALQLMPVFYRPSIAFAIEMRRVERPEEDDEGDTETPVKHLNRQLKRIRRGEPIDTLILRL